SGGDEGGRGVSATRPVVSAGAAALHGRGLGGPRGGERGESSRGGLGDGSDGRIAGRGGRGRRSRGGDSPCSACGSGSPRVRDLHVGVDGPAEGCGGDARGTSQPRGVASPGVRGGGIGPGDDAGEPVVRRFGVGAVAVPDGGGERRAFAGGGASPQPEAGHGVAGAVGDDVDVLADAACGGGAARGGGGGAAGAGAFLGGGRSARGAGGVWRPGG